jgi:RNA polymerase sigma-70 factor (ECF subfamily)
MSPLVIPTARAASAEARRNAALVHLVSTCGARGLRIARDLSRSSADAEDAVQEALARAASGYDQVRDPQALEAWFYRVLTHVCLRTLRRQGLLRAWQRWWRTGEVSPHAEATPRADDLLATQQRNARVAGAVAALPAMQRICLTLRYGHDLPVEEIAPMVGIGAGTVKTHLRRALERLRQKLGAEP